MQICNTIMKYKYQLVVLGTECHSSNILIDLFYKKVEELHLNKDVFEIIGKNNLHIYSGKKPAFVFYFGNAKGHFEDVETAKKMLQEGNMILPIYFDNFSAEIPEELSNQNGIKYSSTMHDKIVDLALEAFGKLRESRRVFISYKRDESSSVAIQLYEALEKNNFDVFLDTHSIKQGEPFQDELWHRMSDSDVIVLLDTPGFLTSRWCKEELAEASANQIGIVNLIWPKHSLEGTAEISYPVNLFEQDFVDSKFESKDSAKLTEEKVNSIVSLVESVRARNLAARQDNLITEFIKVGSKYGKEISVQPERFLTEEVGSIADKKRRIFIPTIGVPTSINCNQSDELREEIKEFNVDEIFLIYDDIRIRKKWIKHLDWLNRFLKVKTLKKQDFEEWFQMN